MKKFNKILFATDFSFISEYAFGHALTLAQKFDAKLIIMHVINIPSALHGIYTLNISFEQIEAEIAISAEKMLDNFCSKKIKFWNSMHESNFTDYEECTVFGVPHEEILKKADEERVDILVIGTHSRAEINRYLFGSTAERVVRKAACPVITVRPPFWMICMKFRRNLTLPLTDSGCFATIRNTGNDGGSGTLAADE